MRRQQLDNREPRRQKSTYAVTQDQELRVHAVSTGRAIDTRIQAPITAEDRGALSTEQAPWWLGQLPSLSQQKQGAHVTRQEVKAGNNDQNAKHQVSHATRSPRGLKRELDGETARPLGYGCGDGMAGKRIVRCSEVDCPRAWCAVCCARWRRDGPCWECAEVRSLKAVSGATGLLGRGVSLGEFTRGVEGSWWERVAKRTMPPCPKFRGLRA